MKGVEPAYTAHVRRLYSARGDQDGFDLARLFAAGEAVQHIVRQPGWSAVMDLLSVEREDIQSRLEGPKPLEHAESSHLLGQLRGLKAAESAAQALSEHYRVEFDKQRQAHEATAEPVAGR